VRCCLKDKIKQIVEDHAGLAAKIDSLDSSTDLYSAGMTSHSSVTLMLALENDFGVEFPPDLLNRSVFESIDSIALAIEGLIPAASHSSL
jgi:acyl carrier protein